MNVKNINKISAGSRHFCYLIDSASKQNEFSALDSYKAYLKEKLKEKKHQLIRLIDGNKHIVVAIVHKDSKEEESNRYEELRKLGFEIAKKFNTEKAADIVFQNADNCLTEPEYMSLLEGAMLGDYSFDKYKSKKDRFSIKTFSLYKNTPKPLALKEMLNVVACNHVARDLINEPVISLNAIKFGKEISKLSKESGFKVKILNKAEITKLKMGGLLGVNLGSVDPPIFAILEWKPVKVKNKKPYVLVGKGVVYDTGGYNLKTGVHMATMKCDMSGAAAVVGAMAAVSKNKLPLHVVGLIPITDNRIGGNALVADDVIKMMDGTTVEILNTDAEGRLILADALTYAKRYHPKLVIDLATLTGAASAITGSLGTALMGSADEQTKSDLIKCGDQVYERLAELPFWKEYADMLKSKVADLKNIGGSVGGAITAGKFLEHFTDYPWIHLDIAGPAFIDNADSYKSAGGTGVGVRVLYQFLKSRT